MNAKFCSAWFWLSAIGVGFGLDIAEMVTHWVVVHPARPDWLPATVWAAVGLPSLCCLCIGRGPRSGACRCVKTKWSDDKAGCLMRVGWFLVLGCLALTVFVTGLAQFVTLEAGLVLACIGCAKSGGGKRRKWIGCGAAALLAIGLLIVYFTAGCGNSNICGVNEENYGCGLATAGSCFGDSYTLAGCADPAHCGTFRRVRVRCTSGEWCPGGKYERPGSTDPTLCAGVPAYQKGDGDGPVLYRVEYSSGTTAPRRGRQLSARDLQWLGLPPLGRQRPARPADRACLQHGKQRTRDRVGGKGCLLLLRLRHHHHSRRPLEKRECPERNHRERFGRAIGVASGRPQPGGSR